LLRQELRDYASGAEACGEKGGKMPALLIYGALIASRDQQPANDFGLSDFERPISLKLFVLLVPEGGDPHGHKEPADFESPPGSNSSL
jgi:hypothetical protein